MGFERKPGWINSAIKSKDRERLSAAGKKGAEVRKKNLELTADRAEVEAQMVEERLIAEDLEMRESANEHIIPVDED